MKKIPVGKTDIKKFVVGVLASAVVFSNLLVWVFLFTIFKVAVLGWPVNNYPGFIVFWSAVLGGFSAIILPIIIANNNDDYDVFEAKAYQIVNGWSPFFVFTVVIPRVIFRYLKIIIGMVKKFFMVWFVLPHQQRISN